jgi:hypothetical protein
MMIKKIFALFGYALIKQSAVNKYENEIEQAKQEKLLLLFNPNLMAQLRFELVALYGAEGFNFDKTRILWGVRGNVHVPYALNKEVGQNVLKPTPLKKYPEYSADYNKKIDVLVIRVN